MFFIGREIHFSYGHRILNHPGRCAHLHGHNGRAIVEVSSERLDSLNMVVDFSQIREQVGAWVKEALDHRTILWEKDPLVKVLQKAGEPVVVMSENPTAEALARWIFREARAKRLAVSRVILWETADSYAAYHE